MVTSKEAYPNIVLGLYWCNRRETRFQHKPRNDGKGERWYVLQILSMSMFLTSIFGNHVSSQQTIPAGEGICGTVRQQAPPNALKVP